MNIWLINHYAVPPKYYPLARQTNFAKNLMAMGHTVTIFAASSVHNSDINLITDGRKWREETVDGVHYVYIRCCDYQGSGLKRIYNICEFAWKLPGVCKHFSKPDAIVATSMPPTSCAMGVRMGRKWGCKTVAEIADLWPESIVAFGIAGPHHPAVLALRRLEKWIYKKADAVVFTMEGAYDYIVEQGWEKDIPRSKVHYINNGVDLEQFDDNREHFRVEDPDLADPNLFKVVYTGSIRHVNGLGILVDTAKYLKNPAVKLLIYGDGDERAALEQRVREEGLTNIVFKGKVEKKYVPSVVSQADLNLVHWGQVPLLKYGVSYNKLFDYMAAGHPIFSTVRPGYSILEKHDCGREAKEFTPASFAAGIDAMAALSGEELARLGANARKGAEEYDFAVLSRKLLNVIESIGGK